MFDLETNSNSTCHHQLSIENALDLFDVMNVSHVEKLMEKKEKGLITLNALGHNANYTLVIFLDSTKRMAVLEGVENQPVSYRVCYHSKLTTPWVTIGLIYFIMTCVIVILVVAAINTCLKRPSSSPPPTQQQQQQQGPWARFLSILKPSNTEPQNDSS